MSLHPPMNRSDFQHDILLAIASQAPILLVASIILDGGFIERVSFCAFGGFWGGVLIMLVRRGNRPLDSDRQFIRLGSWPLFGIAMLMAAIRIRWI